MTNPPSHLVAVIGAGPAGLFAARELASAGAYVLLFNRDIKPGGLAEYGIYFDKHKMKEGLRNQFRQILSMPNIEYFGNIMVGEQSDIRLNDLKDMGVQATLLTVGAQGTKWLGLHGEDLSGVYHAKDIVYHYNRLPPYSLRPYQIGKRVIIIGVGNVMMDIARYLIRVRQVDEVTAIARRGPGEVKFTRAELETVVANLDVAAYDAELENARPSMETVSQDPQLVSDAIHGALEKAEPCDSKTRFSMRFLLSPVRIIANEECCVGGLEVEENVLEMGPDGEVKARGAGHRQVLPADTIIFAIGDRVDEYMGLPVKSGEFVKNPSPLYPIDELSYELYDPVKNQQFEGIFAAGWARKASYGLVGVARKDGVNGAKAVLRYLQTRPEISTLPLESIHTRLYATGRSIVTRTDLEVLEKVEQNRAFHLGLPEFKFDNNADMLAVMGMGVPRPISLRG